MVSENQQTAHHIEQQETQSAHRGERMGRFLFLYFLDDGILARHITMQADVAREGRKLFFRNLSEKNFHRSRAFKAFLWATFFPFRYKVVCIAPHCYGHSKLFKIGFTRANPKAPLTEEELNGYFSQSIWKELEKNKKDVVEKNSFDDLTALLANNAALEAHVGKKRFSESEFDTLIGTSGTSAEFFFLQSFVYRPLFAAVHRTIPKRARITSFFEGGFGRALRIRMRGAEEGKDKKFVFVAVGNAQTDVFAYDGTSLAFHDSFAFGYRTLYEAFHAKLHVDFESFGKILKTFAQGDVSPEAGAFLGEVLSEELGRFQNGIALVKKQLSISSHLIYPGKLGFLLERHKKIAPYLVSSDFVEEGMDAVSPNARPDVYMLKLLLKKNRITRLSTKFIRWLIPHTIEV